MDIFDNILNLYASLSENWQIAIFSVSVPSIVGAIFFGIKNTPLLFKSKITQESDENLAEELSKVSGSIREMLSNYTVELEHASWKPNISASKREFCITETSRIEAQIDELFKKHFEHRSLLLLKRACIILSKTDYSERTKILTGAFLLNEYCDYINEVAEELKVVEKPNKPITGSRQ